MNKRALKATLIAVGVLAVIGTVGAEGYYSHESAEQAAARESMPVSEAPVTAQAKDQIGLQEQGDNYVVRAKFPGASKSDINVKLDGRLLSISSDSHGSEEQKADNGRVIGHESYSDFVQEAYTLPGPVNASGMQTQFKDGILTVTIPKSSA
jgi:HSP20 family molecular chaperone IbpA